MKILPFQRQNIYSLFLLLQMLLIFSSTSVFAIQPLDIAPFDQASFNTTEARAIWVSEAGPTNLRAEDRNGKSFLVVPCNQPNQVSWSKDRCHYDSTLPTPKDFSIYKEFALDIYVPDPEAVNNITLYFESVANYAGYYAQSIVPQLGWQTLRFSVEKMGGASGASASLSSWTHINKIRISPWKGTSAAPTELEIRGFRAIPRSPVAVIKDSSSEQFYKQTSDILTSAFINHDLMSIADIENGYLSRAATSMVVLPYNTALSATAIAKLQDFVAAGGRLTAFGSIDPWLQSLLGVSTSGAVPNSQVSFQFSDSVMTNLPSLVKQVSTPIQVAASYPAGGTDRHARVIATWNSGSGATQYPAWIASDTGLYMSSALLRDKVDMANAGNQWKMLAILMNQYVPNLGLEAAANAFTDSQHIGQYIDLATAMSGIRSNEPQLASARVSEIEASLAQVSLLQGSFNQAISTGNYISAIELSRSLKLDLRNAYNLGQLPGPAEEFRGVWSHDGFGPYKTSGGWATAIPLLRDNGFNAVITNVSGAGFVHYNSQYTDLRSAESITYGDQLAAIIQAAHAVGIKVHAWDLVWNMYNTNMAGPWYARILAEQRLMGRAYKDSSGNYQVQAMSGPSSEQNWLSPCHPENRAFKKAAILEMASNYDIDGIHLDYNRADGEMTLYEDSCRLRFQLEKAVTVNEWPKDVMPGGSKKEQYDEWRSSVITSFTKEIHDALIPINNQKRHLGKPIVVLSAAVFPDPTYAKKQNAQDWLNWIDQGIIDQLHPMNYTSDLAVFNELLRKQNLAIGKRVPFYPGIGVVTDMPSDSSVAQLVATRSYTQPESATGGFTLYNFGNVFAADYLSIFGRGPTSNVTAQVTPVLLSQYFSYNEGVDGGNLTSVAQVNNFIAGHSPAANFIATKFDYGSDEAFYSDLGRGTNLQSFLGADSVSLSADPVDSSDAIIRMYGKVKLAAGTYNFKVRGDDGYQIKIDNNVVALVDTIQPPTGTVHSSFTLTTGGLHSLEILYWDQGGQAVFKAEISGDGGNSYEVLHISP